MSKKEQLIQDFSDWFVYESGQTTNDIETNFNDLCKMSEKKLTAVHRAFFGDTM